VLRLQRREPRAHAFGDLDLAGAAAARDLETDDGRAVEQRRRAALGDRVAHAGDVGEPHAASVGQRDRHARELVGRSDGGDRAHRLLGAADVGSTARRVLLDAPQLPRDVGRRRADRQHPVRIELDRDLARHAAHARHGATPGTASSALLTVLSTNQDSASSSRRSEAIV